MKTLSLPFQDPGSELHYTDVRQLHQMMVADINTLRGVGASAQRHSLLEVKKIVYTFCKILSGSGQNFTILSG